MYKIKQTFKVSAMEIPTDSFLFPTKKSIDKGIDLSSNQSQKSDLKDEYIFKELLIYIKTLFIN